MQKLRYEAHITKDPRLPFIIYSDMTITRSFFNPVPNWHDDIELLNCRSGEGYVFKDGRRVDFRAGDTVIIEPLVIHNVYSEGSVNFFAMMPGRNFCMENGIETDDMILPDILRDPEIDRLFARLEADTLNEGVCRVARIRRSVLDIIIAMTEGYSKNPDDMDRQDRQSFAHVRNAIKYIRDNYAADINIDSIARAAGINKYSLSREFRKGTGRSMIEYLNDYRCRMAYDHLKNGMSVAEAAELCGFSNYSYFAKIFRSVMGVLPSKVGSEGSKREFQYL